MLQNVSLPALCPTLDAAIIRMVGELVPSYRVSETAPSTYSELCEWMQNHDELIVYSGGSENTIFGSSSVNYSFRAWHDWTHWSSGYDFSLVGEMFTCNEQITQLLSRYSPNVVTDWIPYLTAEVIGQRLYYERYREYIIDQRAFVVAYIKDYKTALSRKW